MTKRAAAVIVFPAFAMLALYLGYTQAPASLPLAAAAQPAGMAVLPGIHKAGQGKVWVCPMHREIMQDHPGKCPICGMDLVASNDNAGHDHGIRVDTATIQKLGVRLAPVKMSTISREINTYGNVTADGSAIYNINSNFEGWIKKTYIHAIGQNIEQGQVIYEIYSPELIMQQKGYLKFLERRDQILQSAGDSRFQENEYVMGLLQDLSVERTKFLRENIGLETVQRLEDSRQPVQEVKILAAESGVVTQINTRAGSFVMPSSTLFTVANVGKLWVDITLYPDQVGQVQLGDAVSIRDAGGREIKSRLSFISPVAENNKVVARVALDNMKYRLRPGTFADVVIHAQAHAALVLPRTAVIYTGAGSMVMLSRGDGHFLPVPVETGGESGDNVEVVDGLREGAEVAVNGQFLLDAASSMNAAAERMRSGQHD